MKKPPDGSIGSETLEGATKVLEEMSELGVELAKALAMGHMGKHWSGRELKKKIEQEIADVLATLSFFVENNDIDHEAIDKRCNKKFKKFCRWQKNIKEGRDPNDNGKDDRVKRKP